MWEGEVIAPSILNLGTEGEWASHSGCLTPRVKPLIDQKAGWFPEFIWKLWGWDIFLPLAGNQHQLPEVSGLLTELSRQRKNVYVNICEYCTDSMEKRQSLPMVKKSPNLDGRRSFINFSHNVVTNFRSWSSKSCSTDNSLFKRSL